MRAILHRITVANMSWYGREMCFLASLPCLRRDRLLGGQVRNSESAMTPAVRRFFARVHTVFVSIADFLKNFFPTTGGDFGSQRMCPFCGLITSSRKAHCLECGKVLKPA
jgi:hypothetical protein